MATNPTRRIRAKQRPNPFGVNADDFLDQLSDLAPAVDVPYLTISVDWSIEGSSPGRGEPEQVRRSQNRAGWEPGNRQRPALGAIEREIDSLIDAHGPRGDAHDSLVDDKEKVLAWLNDELDPSASGAFIVANSSRGVFEATGFALPMETQVTAGPAPVLYKLVRLIEDNPAYAVLLADQTTAELSFISWGQVLSQVMLEGSGYPRHQQTGGWAQRRLQRRANERIEAFARDVADETRKALDESGVDALIVAGDEVITSALDPAFHSTVKDRIIDNIRLGMNAGEHELIEATLPLAERDERERESANVKALLDAVGADHRGVSGRGRTLRALQSGQVSELYMVDSFEGIGWADFGMGLYGAGNRPEEHPLGGSLDDIVEIDLRDEMVRLAIGSGAEVDIIHSSVPVGAVDETGPNQQSPVSDAARRLLELGGVGGLLRYSAFEGSGNQR